MVLFGGSVTGADGTTEREVGANEALCAGEATTGGHALCGARETAGG